MKIFLSVLLSVFVLGLLTICGFFAYSMYESNQLNNKSIQANNNQEIEHEQDSNDLQLDESQTNTDSTQTSDSPQNAEECLLALIDNNPTCSLDDYSNQQLAGAYESLIDQGILEFWCHPGGDIGAVKRTITESISNKQNGIVCKSGERGESNEEDDSNVVTRDNVFDYLIEAIDSEEGNNHNLIVFQEPKMKSGYWEIAANNKSGAGSYTFKVYTDGTVEFWNGPMTDMSLSKKVELD